MTRAWTQSLLPVLLLWAAGCAGTPDKGPGPEVPSGADARVEALREGVRQLVERQADLYWRSWVFGEEVRLSDTYAGHEALFTEEALETVRAAIDRADDPDRRRALERLRDFLLGEYVARQVGPLDARVAEVEASATVEVDGDRIPYRDLGRLLANEPDAARRRELNDAAVPVLARINPALEEKEAKAQAVARGLGYAGYAALSEDLRDVDLEATARLARRLLDETEGLYRQALEAAARRELGYGLDEVRRADVPRLFRGAGLDAHFPAEDMVPRLSRALEGMGLGFDAGGRIAVHAESLARKNPRAVCFPVTVPDDVRLSIKPVGGLTDYQALFHEMGHAQHYAHTRTRAFELQQLGANTVTETYAFLLEDLLAHPAWLSGHTGLTGAELQAVVQGQALQRLFMVRRYSAKLLYELAWHRGELEGHADAESLYGALMSRAYGFPLDPSDRARWLSDHDDFFYTADYLRAWVLEAQLEADLARRFGERWWTKRDAGRYLQTLWAEGTRLGVPGLLARLDARRLDPEPLLRRLRARLAPPAA